ncbi:hypothetical protein LLG96_01740 [bacterium]|nr:hypothetical protein [bacterium]
MNHKYLDEKDKHSPESFSYGNEDVSIDNDKHYDSIIDSSDSSRYRKIRAKSKIIGHVQE